MKRKGIHVEVTTLLIPDLNDDPDEIRALCRFLVENLGPDTPLHISRFFPHYKSEFKPPTPIKTRLMARDIAVNEGVKFVYVGNVPGSDYENTFCPSCGKVLVERVGYDITGWFLTEDMRCKYCGEKIPIVGKYERRGRWRILGF